MCWKRGRSGRTAAPVLEGWEGKCYIQLTNKPADAQQIILQSQNLFGDRK